MKRMVSIMLTLIIIVVGGAVFVHAQDATETIDLTLSNIPLNPQPLQQVTISAQSYSTDLTQDSLVWTYNGQSLASGIGLTQVTVTAPASGVTGTITLTVSGNDISATSASLVLRPASVDLLWEGADSYTPPFYKGRALPSTGAIIRVVAIPTINSPTDLTYNWSQNGDAVPDSSGYDKSSFLFLNNILDTTEHIEVSEENGGFSGDGSIDITPGDPTVVGYLNNSGYIDYANGSTDMITSNANGAIVHIEPYYFSAPHGISQDLNVAFSDSNNSPLASGDFENELRLSRPDGGGESQFNITVSTIKYSLQNVSRVFSINFI
jgi:hypothetical protein